MGKSKAEAERVTAMLSRSFAKQVRTIADHRDITMADVLDQYAGAVIGREYRKCLDEMNRELGEAGA